MKKFSTLLKGFAAIAVVLGFSSQAKAAYPNIEDLLANKYTFVAMDFTLDQDYEATYGSVLKSSFSFTLTGTNESPIIKNFLFNGSSFNCIYNEEDGTLKINTITLKPVSTGSFFAFSPEDNPFNGKISASTGSPLILQIQEDGEILVPNFAIGPYKANVEGLTTDVAVYKDIITGIEGKDYGDSAPAKNFEGTYPFTGTQIKYTYDEAGEQSSEKSAGDFNFVIKYTEDKWEIKNDEGVVVRSGTNYYNNIVEIAGYKIAEQDIAIHNTKVSIEGNTITYEADFSNGVLWNSEPTVSLDDNTYYTSLVFGGESITEWEQGEPAVVFTMDSAEEYSLAPFTIWKRTPIIAKNAQQEDILAWDYQVIYYWTSEVDATEPEPEPGEDAAPFAGTYSFNGTFYNYVNGELTSTSDGFFDLVINNAGQVSAIGQNEVPLALLNEGVNMGEANEDDGIYTLTTGENTLVGTDPTLLLGGGSTEAYAAGETIVLTVSQNEYTLTPFTVWREEEDGTYSLVYKWDSNLYQGITLTNGLAEWNEEGELEVTFTANLTNIEAENVDEWLANFVYTDASGAEKTIEATASYEGNTASVVLTELEEGTYSFTVTLSAIADDEVIATSNELTILVSSTAISGLNAAGAEKGVYYNLQGVPVANPQNGIFILNGKKVVIR